MSALPRAQARELLAGTRTLLAGDELEPWARRAADLRELDDAVQRLERRYTLAVVGEFSSGKSFLLNALLGKVRREDDGRIAGLLAVDINPSTATITELEYAAEESALARYGSGREERIPLDRLSRFVAVGKDERGALHDATADVDAAPEFVVVRTDSPFLQSGFVLADTPGLASINPAHRRATLGYLPRADAVLYLIDTQQPFTEGDAAFLGLIGQYVRTIFIVQTKIDLWQMPEGDGQPAWRHANERIVARARQYAPSADVFAVSARDFALATLDGDAELRARSGVPAFTDALAQTLAQRTQAARIARSLDVVTRLLQQATARVQREAALLERDRDELLAQRDAVSADVVQREGELEAERDALRRQGEAQESLIVARTATLASDLVRALGGALDVADIERLRDRGRMHALVDATVAPAFKAFAVAIAAGVAAELERSGEHYPALGPFDVAARALGGEPGSGTWSQGLGSGITSSIVLEGIGGPTVSFVHAVATAFARRPHGAYMKRELGADLGATFFPLFERELAAFGERLAARIAGIYRELAQGLSALREEIRSDAEGPIDRALATVGDDARLSEASARLAAANEHLAALEATARGLAASAPPPAGGTTTAAQAPHAAVPFDADAYDRGLRPERYRVVIVGALRRGKSSLINAIAGTRLLRDEGGREATFPIHVRYGAQSRAFALESEGAWHEIATADAMAQAARTPVLIEIPWTLPQQLVLVHAPAFDSGSEGAEAVTLAAAQRASEVVALFSRQLSDRELALYERIAAFEKPLMLAHTIADNESPSERRNVVALAQRYVDERHISVERIFTISALDYFDAAQRSRPAAAWNELGALRDTLAAHAEEHMHRLAQRERAAARSAAGTAGARAPQEAPRGALRRAFERLLKGGE